MKAPGHQSWMILWIGSERKNEMVHLLCSSPLQMKVSCPHCSGEDYYSLGDVFNMQSVVYFLHLYPISHYMFTL